MRSITACCGGVTVVTGVAVGTSRLALTDGTRGDTDVVFAFGAETVELVEAAIFFLAVKVQNLIDTHCMPLANWETEDTRLLCSFHCLYTSVRPLL